MKLPAWCRIVRRIRFWNLMMVVCLMELLAGPWQGALAHGWEDMKPSPFSRRDVVRALDTAGQAQQRWVDCDTDSRGVSSEAFAAEWSAWLQAEMLQVSVQPERLRAWFSKAGYPFPDGARDFILPPAWQDHLDGISRVYDAITHGKTVDRIRRISRDGTIPDVDQVYYLLELTRVPGSSRQRVKPFLPEIRKIKRMCTRDRG